MGTSICLVTNILQTLQKKKKTLTGLEQLEGEALFTLVRFRFKTASYNENDPRLHWRFRCVSETISVYTTQPKTHVTWPFMQVQP